MTLSAMHGRVATYTRYMLEYVATVHLHVLSGFDYRPTCREPTEEIAWRNDGCEELFSASWGARGRHAGHCCEDDLHGKMKMCQRLAVKR